MAQYVAAGGRLMEPVIFLSEVAGAVSRRTGNTVAGQEAVIRLRAIAEVQIVPVDHALGQAAAEAAATMRLRGADAVYVALAQSFNVPLITWDAEQHQRTAGRIA